MDHHSVRFVALGGLGEVGLNCFALEQENDVIVVDCGITFPASDCGVDVLHPRFDFLLERRDRLRGIIITHGHEDHIGALPYLLDLLDAPIYAPRHALALIRRRLDEHHFDLTSVELHEISPRTPFAVGSFEVETIRVTHSITEANALAIRTHAGVVVHTGDFKFDPNPMDGERTDVHRLAELGDAGVRLLLSDSTNIESRGRSTSESVVGSTLDDLIAQCAGRIVIGMFPSNVQRLISIFASAERHQRRVCLLGRSMLTHVDVATSIGKLVGPASELVAYEQVASIQRDKLLVLSTGTQAEPQAALTRIAKGVHPKLRLEQGDSVILSSRIIPGNDRPVYEMMGNLIRLGIQLHTRGSDALIHGSGHAHRDELAEMISLVRPQAFIPVHGTTYHLARHAELARDMLVPQVLMAENGDVVSFDQESPPALCDRANTGRVATFALNALPDEVLRDRVKLARHGIAVVVIALPGNGTPAGEPRVLTSGVVGPLEHDTHRIAERAVSRALAEQPRSERRNLVDIVRLAARNALEAETGQRPNVIVFDTAAGS